MLRLLFSAHSGIRLNWPGYDRELWVGLRTMAL
ncbi:MAG: hypothetical protein K0Q72_662 [Armatimonadetes bacterium]|jgi:hypothetical protein|nr:hypothetical protein [Armatimonadota bacterium]